MFQTLHVVQNTADTNLGFRIMPASYTAEVHVLTLHRSRILSMVEIHGWVKLVTSLPGFMKIQTLCKRNGKL